MPITKNVLLNYAHIDSAYIKRFQKSHFFIRKINLEIQLILNNFRNDARHYRKLIINYFTLKSIELSQNPRKYINDCNHLFQMSKETITI